MNYTLGNSDIHLQHPVAFGCMSLQSADQEASYVLRKAADEGIQLFDTADLYEKGANEILVGKALAPIRQHIYLCSKVGNAWRPDGSGWDWNPRKEYLITAVEQSLKRLKTDYLDLCLLHGGTKEDPFDEVYEAFVTLQQQGKIRYYGLSSLRPNVIRTWIDHSEMIALMIPYSLLDRRAEEEIWSWLEKAKISALVRGTTAQGLLLKDKTQDYLDYAAKDIQSLKIEIQQHAQQEGVSPLHILLQCALSPSVVQAAVLGMRNEQQLKEALQALSKGIKRRPLPKEIAQHLHPQTFEAHRLDANT